MINVWQWKNYLGRCDIQTISDRRLKIIVFKESLLNRVFVVFRRFLDVNVNPPLNTVSFAAIFWLSSNALSQILFQQKEGRDRLNFLLNFFFQHANSFLCQDKLGTGKICKTTLQSVRLLSCITILTNCCLYFHAEICLAVLWANEFCKDRPDDT